jgi:putative hydrolase of the HAD superfamily
VSLPVVAGRPVRAALLDLDDTLVDRTTAFRRWLEALMQRHPRAFADPERDLATLLRIDDRGKRDRRAFYDTLLQRHPELVRAGLDAEALQQDIVASLASVVVADPRVVAAVEGLRARGLGLAIVTNGSSANQRAKLARSGVAHLVDAVIVSGEVGVSKPAPEVYALALAALKADPGDALFVGDDPVRDIAGPARVGLRTCWVSHGDRWPYGPDDPELRTPDLIVSHIGDLLDRLA